MVVLDVTVNKTPEDHFIKHCGKWYSHMHNRQFELCKWMLVTRDKISSDSTKHGL